MKDNDQIGYALKDGQLVHISEVPRGLACTCFCVACNSKLIARKGSKRKHHFAHTFNSHCDGGIETTLHRLAKEIFLGIDQFVIPSYNFHMERKTKSGEKISHDKLVANGGNVAIDSVGIESAALGFIPDIVITSNHKKLLVEIAVTHLVDRNKMRRIRKFGFPTIEIRLNRSDALLSKAELTEKLQTDAKCKIWLFHPLQKEAEAEFYAQFRNAIRFKKKAPLDSPTQPVERPKWIPAQYVSGHDRDAFDRAGDEFFRKHGRYPSIEECLQLWPWMRK